MSGLRELGYVDANRGPGGGYWLTPEGSDAAKKLPESES
jgi:DNA-binding IscR family transcriptional regulator